MDFTDDNSSSTATEVYTPPESVTTGFKASRSSSCISRLDSSSVPWPNSTFVIRSVSTGEVITLTDGMVTLAPVGGRGSIHWMCVETKGWLGFRNTVSGKYLGHDDHGRLCCTVKHHSLWEWFCVRMKPGGGFVLFMTHWERLWQVGFVDDKGIKKMAKIGGDGIGILWEFVKVE